MNCPCAEPIRTCDAVFGLIYAYLKLSLENVLWLSCLGSVRTAEIAFYVEDAGTVGDPFSHLHFSMFLIEDDLRFLSAYEAITHISCFLHLACNICG